MRGPVAVDGAAGNPGAVHDRDSRQLAEACSHLYGLSYRGLAENVTDHRQHGVAQLIGQLAGTICRRIKDHHGCSCGGKQPDHGLAKTPCPTGNKGGSAIQIHLIPPYRG